MFTGSIVALIAPMHANGELDKVKFRDLVQWHLAEGTKGLVINGTTGEGPTLTPAERLELLQLAVEATANKIPVIAGTGTNSTATTITETKAAIEIGVAGCLLVAPYYNRPTQEGLYQHFKAVAEACPIPLVLYNVPHRTASDIAVQTVARLAKIANIVGIKEATGEITRVSSLRASCGHGFTLLSGDDSSVLAFMQAGGDGVISVAANVVPKLMTKLCALCLEKTQPDYAQQAEVIDKQLAPLYAVLGLESNPIPVKWALAQMGLSNSELRLPLTKLSVELQPKVTAVLAELSLLQDS